MKKIVVLLIIIVPVVLCKTMFSQVGINTLDPHESTILHIKSGDEYRGMLFPANDQNTEFSTDTNGLFHYNTSYNRFFYYRGSLWQCLNPFNAETPGNITAPGDFSVNEDLTVNENLTVSDAFTVTNKLSINNSSINFKKNTTFDAQTTFDKNATFNESIEVTGGNLTVSSPHTISGYGSVPIGTIVMWHGNKSDIPDGWQICDGTGDTPDLVKNLIMGGETKGNDDKIEYEESNKYYIGGKDCEKWEFIYTIEQTREILDDTGTEDSTVVDIIEVTANDSTQAKKRPGLSCDDGNVSCKILARDNNGNYYYNKDKCISDGYRKREVYRLIFIMRVK